MTWLPPFVRTKFHPQQTTQRHPVHPVSLGAKVTFGPFGSPSCLDKFVTNFGFLKLWCWRYIGGNLERHQSNLWCSTARFEVELHHFLFRFKLLLTNNNTQKKPCTSNWNLSWPMQDSTIVFQDPGSKHMLVGPWVRSILDWKRSSPSSWSWTHQIYCSLVVKSPSFAGSALFFPLWLKFDSAHTTPAKVWPSLAASDLAWPRGSHAPVADQFALLPQLLENLKAYVSNIFPGTSIHINCHEVRPSQATLQHFLQQSRTVALGHGLRSRV